MNNTEYLCMIPALYKAYTQNQDDRDALVDVMRWIEHRARGVLKMLIVEMPLPEADPATITPDMLDWKRVCSYLTFRIHMVLN